MLSIQPVSPLPEELTTDRLLLRRWRAADRAGFAAINADPAVMEFFPDVLSSAESDQTCDRIQQTFDAYGFGLWAVEVRSSHTFIGFVGLSVPHYETHFTPCLEIGWRLASDHWGQGLATEGAEAAMQFAERCLRAKEIVAMTATINVRSRRVMEKLDMERDPADDFDHPLVPPGHPVCPHVLYRRRFGGQH
ncbi:MAG: GNAT family N-acetyltransferase [Planctomycetaceae bacterium]|nr:GNAT family N-acetyltransferase [Planctomycetaceae bacterium]